MKSEPTKAARKIPKCPVCGRPRHSEFRPFCSTRCRDRDLSKWLDGAYAIPVVEEEEDRDGMGATDPDDR